MKKLCTAALLLTAAACGSKSPASTAPTIVATVAPKIGTPSPQSPIDGQLATTLTVTLTAGTATVDNASFTLQYRFQIFNTAGTLALDSGLVAAPQWTTPAALTPNASFTWKVRAETQGFAGPWSDSASFATADPPVAYNRPIGDWQSCASIGNKVALVTCVWRAVHPTDTVSAMEVTKRVAWLLRGEGAGLLIKSSGENVIVWQGYSLSATRICYPDGHIWKLLSDAGPGGTNLPEFADNDFVDPSFYVKAIDPSKP